MAERIGFITLRHFDLPDPLTLHGIQTKDRILQHPSIVLDLGQSHPAIPLTQREAPALSRTPDQSRTIFLADLKPLLDAYWQMIIQRARDKAIQNRIDQDREADRIAAYQFYVARDRFGDWVRALLFERTWLQAMELHEAYLKSSAHKLDLAERFTRETREQRIERAGMFPILYQKAVDNPFLTQPKFPNQIKLTPETLEHMQKVSEKHRQLHLDYAADREQLSQFLLGKMLSKDSLAGLIQGHTQELIEARRRGLWLDSFDRAWQESLADSQWFRDTLREELLVYDKTLSQKSVEVAWQRPTEALARVTFASWLSPAALTPKAVPKLQLPHAEAALLTLTQDPLIQESQKRVLAQEGKLKIIPRKSQPESTDELRTEKPHLMADPNPAETLQAERSRMQKQLLFAQYASAELNLREQTRTLSSSQPVLDPGVLRDAPALAPIDPTVGSPAVQPETRPEWTPIRTEQKRAPPE